MGPRVLNLNNHRPVVRNATNVLEPTHLLKSNLRYSPQTNLSLRPLTDVKLKILAQKKHGYCIYLLQWYLARTHVSCLRGVFQFCRHFDGNLRLLNTYLLHCLPKFQGPKLKSWCRCLGNLATLGLESEGSFRWNIKTQTFEEPL